MPDETAPATAAALPVLTADAIFATNNTLYARLMELAGAWRVLKPSRFLVSLLPDDTPRPKHSDENEEGSDTRDAVADHSQLQTTTLSAASSTPTLLRAPDVPQFSRRTFVDLSNDGEGRPVVLGNTGVVCLLELFREAPLLERIDLSPLPSLFASDAFKAQRFDGNAVIARLCDVAVAAPRLAEISLGAQPIGTVAVKALTAAVAANASIVGVTYDDPSIVDPNANAALEAALRRNRDGRNDRFAMPPTALSPRLRALRAVDRKTSAERQRLRVLLWEHRAAFLGAFEAAAAGAPAAASTAPLAPPGGAATAGNSDANASDEAVDVFVRSADVVPLGEVVRDCRGLRGDGAHLFIVASGAITASVGGQTVVLRRGDYFGEPLECAMYPAGAVSVLERGAAFRVPFAFCGGLVGLWERRVEAFLPHLRTVAPFQSAPLWALVRCCHTAAFIDTSPGGVALARGAAFAGLFVVVSGTYEVAARPKRRVDPAAAAAGTASSADDAVAAAAAASSRTTPTATATASSGFLVFGPGDVFGEEPCVARTGKASVDVTASQAAPNDASTVDRRCLLLAPGPAEAHLVGPFKGLWRVQARLYSRHDL